MIIRINRGLVTVNRVFVAVLFLILVGIATWVWLGIFDNVVPVETVCLDGSVSGDCLKREVLTPSVYPGGKLRIHVITIPHRICDVKVDRVIYDGSSERKTIDQPVEYTSSTPAEINKAVGFIYSIQIPDDVAPGDAHYVAQAKYRCTYFQKLFGPIVGDVITIDFKITARTTDEQNAFDAVKKLLGQPKDSGSVE